jgi:hypothetical protein
MKGFFVRPQRIAFGLWLVLGLGALPATAGEPWLAPGDMRVRHDIQLLVDSGVINLPMSGWPIAVSDLAYALDNARTTAPQPVAPIQAAATPPTSAAPTSAAAGRADPASSDSSISSATVLTPAHRAALTRLRRIASEGRPTIGFEVAGAARPMQLRMFGDTPREEGELTAYAAGFIGNRFGGRLEVTAVADPDDDKDFRLDGSYVAGKFGNWIVTLGEQERWWGSGWEGSLILSNNARPVPAIALDRAVSKPFETKWLSWLGPWRLTTFMGEMEGDRQDYANPLLFGMRISARPLDGLEISVERTAQWCGEGRSCDWDDFWNLFWGNDNAGENVAAEDEPGNQLASWDIRWASPIGNWNYALYNQHTGETIDNTIPRPYRSFDVVGLENRGVSKHDGSSWRAGLEWSNSRCGGTENEQRIWDCAYNNGIFDPDGYRYYGRPMGHSMDGDGQMYSARFVRVGETSATLTAVLRYTMINEGGVVPDTRHSVAPGPEDWISVDVTYRHPLRMGWVEASAGGDYRDRQWNDTDSTLPRFSVTWHHGFQ